jgi:hypothetical protein
MAAPPPNEQSGGGTMTEEKLLAGKVALVTGQVLRVDGGTQCWPG